MTLGYLNNLFHMQSDNFEKPIARTTKRFSSNLNEQTAREIPDDGEILVTEADNDTLPKLNPHDEVILIDTSKRLPEVLT